MTKELARRENFMSPGVNERDEWNFMSPGANGSYRITEKGTFVLKASTGDGRKVSRTVYTNKSKDCITVHETRTYKVKKY